MIHLAAADIVVIVLYFGLVMYVGFRTVKKSSADEEDFLLAGRSLTLPVFVMTLVSTWYGGILGVGEFSYRYGISNWVIQGVPYYVFAAVFAFFLAKKVRATNLFSIPDKLAQSYDKRTAVLGAGLTFILMTPAPYILMLSVFIQMLFGWNLLISLLVTAVTAISYLYAGGFRADVETDVVEFILMFVGFAVILPYAVMTYGGFDYLKAHLPPLHLTWHGGNSMQFIIVWFFIALWTLVDPAFHQRCYAASSGKVAQRGILVSIIFWCVFDFMTATAGLYARAALPNLANPVTAYPMLAEAVLPPFAKGVFYVGMLATIMSTLNTLAFVSAQTLGRDIVMRLSVTTSQPEVLSTRLTKIGLILSLMFSILLALLLPSVISIWYTIGTIIIPGLLVPLIASYFPALHIPARYAFYSMLCGWLTSLLWLLESYAAGRSGTYLLGIEPMYPGLAVSLVLWGCGKLGNRGSLEQLSS
ncbi:MAG TPA: sodium:solute symporter family protein [Bacteroidota bacterium]|jgi:SSS family solute:Na+ symporter|nr:sodium:solute symporter family protein [Bacteroidota bacterium]